MRHLEHINLFVAIKLYLCECSPKQLLVVCTHLYQN